MLLHNTLFMRVTQLVEPLNAVCPLAWSEAAERRNGKILTNIAVECNPISDATTASITAIVK
jgi:hypothetical protein